MSMSVDEFKEYIKELIKKELEEVSVTGALDGGEGPPKTPYAFQSTKKKRKKDKEKEKKISTNSTGYTIAEDIYAFKNQEASNKTFVDSLKDTEWKSDKCEAKRAHTFTDSTADVNIRKKWSSRVSKNYLKCVDDTDTHFFYENWIYELTAYNIVFEGMGQLFGEAA